MIIQLKVIRHHKFLQRLFVRYNIMIKLIMAYQAKIIGLIVLLTLSVPAQLQSICGQNELKGCAVCGDPDNTTLCLTCKQNYKWIPGSTACQQCNPGTFATQVGAHNIQTCSLTCDVICYTCIGPTNTTCISCKGNSGFDVDAYVCATCTDGKYLPTAGTIDGHIIACRSCASGCYECTDGSEPSDTTCLSCKANFGFDEAAHVCATCTNGTLIPVVGTIDGHNTACSPCATGCYECTDGTAASCTKCHAQYKYVSTDNDQKCQACYFGRIDQASGHNIASCSTTLCNPIHNCVTCTDMADATCLSCKLGYAFVSATLSCSLCPSGQTSSATAAGHREQACVPCHFSCIQCSGPTGFYCTSCIQDYRYFPSSANNKCEACQSGTFIADVSGHQKTSCYPCNTKCSVCSGSTDNCHSCKINYIYDSAAKSCNDCPDGTPSTSTQNYHQVATCSSCKIGCKQGIGFFSPPICNNCAQNFRYFPASAITPPCLACQAGTYMPITTGHTNSICIACQVKCSRCTGSAQNCLSCKRIYVYNSPAKTCSECPTGLTSPATTDGHNETACVPCPTFCRECNGLLETQCTRCHQDGILLIVNASTGSGTCPTNCTVNCAACPSSLNCFHCDIDNICKVCYVGFSLFPSTAAGCCLTGQTWSAVSNVGCVACPNSFNCFRCDIPEICAVCNTGFSKLPSNATGCCSTENTFSAIRGVGCVACPYVLNCFRCDAANTCAVCNTPFSKLPGNSAGCCSMGQTFSSSFVSCVSCPAVLNCFRCDTANICAVCNIGVSLLPSTARGCCSTNKTWSLINSLSCVHCLQSLNCLRCDTANTCAVCASGFTLDLASGCLASSASSGSLEVIYIVVIVMSIGIVTVVIIGICLFKAPCCLKKLPAINVQQSMGPTQNAMQFKKRLSGIQNHQHDLNSQNIFIGE